MRARESQNVIQTPRSEWEARVPTVPTVTQVREARIRVIVAIRLEAP